MTVETDATPAQTPAEAFTVENTSRASERFTDVLPATYDEKDDMDLLKAQLQKRKKPIYAGLAFLCVVVIGVSIAVSSGGGTEASTASGIDTTPAPTTEAPAVAEENTAGDVHGVDLSGSASAIASASGSGSTISEAANEAGLFSNSSSGSIGKDDETTDAPTTAPTTAPTPARTDGPLLPWKDLGFNWKDAGNWEYANFKAVDDGMVNEGGITLNSGNSPTPIRTKVSWAGEKIVLIEWERSGSSDTNIWMLNEKFRPNQFADDNGWPYWGELDIFEMFNYDKKNGFDFSGFREFSDVGSYGALTMHTGASWTNKCVCPPSHTKSQWYQNTEPMTAACAAQFSSASTKSMAVVWGIDGNGQFIQLLSNPTVTKGGKVNGQETFDVTPGDLSTMKIYNNNELHWGTRVSDPCVAGAGHNAATGFPFFESFFLVLEEQNKAGDAWFKVTNIQVLKK